jgi:ADP-heptose:LPS heptosyltransferase
MKGRGTFSLRSLERRFKKRLIEGLGVLMRASTASAFPDECAGARRVLYLRYDRIGDMILATGVIRAIAAAQPSGRVDVLASTENSFILSGNPYVETVFTVDKKRPWTYLRALSRIRRARYDAVVDSMILTPSLTTTLLMWASGAKHRVGIAARGNDSAFTLAVAPLERAVHCIDRTAALIAAFGLDPQGVLRERFGVLRSTGSGIWTPEIFLTRQEIDEGQRRWRSADALARAGGFGMRWVVNVSAGSRSRYWPDARFVYALTHVKRLFPAMSTLVVGAPQDVERMERISRAAGVAFALTPRCRQVIAIVAAGDMVLTADTSMTHIASAFGKPTVAMFVGGGGPCYGPYATPSRVVSTQGPSLESLEVGPVVSALEELIAAEHHRRAICSDPGTTTLPQKKLGKVTSRKDRTRDGASVRKVRGATGHSIVRADHGLG